MKFKTSFFAPISAFILTIIRINRSPISSNPLKSIAFNTSFHDMRIFLIYSRLKNDISVRMHPNAAYTKKNNIIKGSLTRFTTYERIIVSIPKTSIYGESSS